MRKEGNVLGNVSHYEIIKKSFREKLTFLPSFFWGGLYIFWLLTLDSPASEGISFIWYNVTLKSSQRDDFEFFKKLPTLQDI